VLGTTRVGKTRLAELFITQDIRRQNTAGEHEVVIVFDPKGDADLLKRMVGMGLPCPSRIGLNRALPCTPGLNWPARNFS
jgi:hypothetical protein